MPRDAARCREMPRDAAGGSEVPLFAAGCLIVWLLMLPAYGLAWRGQESASGCFSCSRRRPMRAPVGGSVCARALWLCAHCAHCGRLAAADGGKCALCVALRWRAARACCARVRVGFACASACAARALACAVCCNSAARPVCVAVRRSLGWQGCAVGCGVLRVVVRLPDGVRRLRSPLDRAVGGPGCEHANARCM